MDMNQGNDTTDPPQGIFIPWLCGKDDAFWNANFWKQEKPEFGPCFALTLWLVPPIITFLAILPFAISTIHKSKSRSSPFSLLCGIKTVILSILAILALGDLITALLNESKKSNAITIVGPIFRLIIFLLALILAQLQRVKGITTSPIHWTFFMVFCFTSTIPLYLIGLQGIADDASFFYRFSVISTIITVVFLVVSFILNFFVEPRAKYEEPQDSSGSQPCPEMTASFPSQIVFGWFTGLAWGGFKRDLVSADLWDLLPSITTRVNSTHFHQNWEGSKPPAIAMNGDHVTFGRNDEVEIRTREPQKAKSILPVLIKTFGRTFVIGSSMKFVHDIFIFFSPYILRLIIQYTKGNEPLWKGIFYSVLLLIIGTFQSIILSQYFYKMYLIGMKMRSALTNAVYKKSLRTSPSSKEDTTTGELVNLMSVDIQRLIDLMPYVNMVWSAPLQIVGAIFFLWQQLGPSVLAGLLVMVLLIPVNGFVAAKSRQYQMRQMKKKDERVKMMSEILQGIKILKLYAWEKSFQKLIMSIRAQEIDILTKMGYLQAGTSFIWSCAPFFVSLVSFAVYVLVDDNHILDSEKAFVSLSLFNILRFPLSMLPMMITMMVQASVSIKRINKFMNSEEINPQITYEKSSGDKDENAIEINGASFSWQEDQKAVLEDISLKIKRGSLVAVVGTVGAGKSSLISAIVGDMHKGEGSAKIRGTIALVPQQAWVQNATLKDNILFGKPYNQERYVKAIEACALKDDLTVLPGGDQTEIGEKGINLSGGQKQRVSIARSMYSQSELFLFDDPLSAVDAHVGKHIFKKVIGPDGCLSNTTRILVTHAMTYLPQVDLIVVIKEGTISEMGTYSQLLAQKGAFAEILIQYLSEEANDEELDEVSNLKHTVEQALGSEEYQKKLARCRSESENQDNVSVCSNKSSEVTASASGSRGSSPRKRTALSPQTSVMGQKEDKKEDTPPQRQKQYEEEKTETGKVKYQVYAYYILNMGLLLSSACTLCYIGYQVFSTGSSIWLSRWADSAVLNQTSHERDMYLGVYGGLGMGQAIFVVFGSICLYLATLSGAKRLHDVMLINILRSPMAFFDTTPQGRILNRFSKDIDVLDATMPMILRGWITCLLAVISTFLIITYTTPIFIAPIFIVLCGYYIVQRIYVASSRQLKRLESITRSPIYSHFGETISGVQTIRAYNLQNMFITESEKRVDDNSKATFPINVANRWLAVRLETVGNIIIFCSALFAVLARDSITPGLVGLSISYALSVTQTLNWLVRMTSDVETNIVAVERLQEYAQNQTEAEWDLDEREKKFEPSEGKIELKNYSTRYREGLNLVLNDISFVIQGGERVGLVGRTGAGKSSLTMAIFRLIEPAGGQILIDGVDITNLGLHELRSKLSIIPQDPVLFSGNLRMNLDPFENHSDDEVLRCLRLAHLGEFYDSLEEGLDYKISEGGTNLSVGQRQLICLARALLRKSKILILDEATAAVDLETDEVIQATIRKEFQDTTILTIAHRLNTIMDYNKIIVLSNGKVAEHDTPDNLIANKNSAFYKMCAEAGLA